MISIVTIIIMTQSSLGDREHIFVTHLIIIITYEVSSLPIVVRFGCVADVAVPSYSVSCFIYIPGKLCLRFD